MSTPISVLIADDHGLFGESLAHLLETVPDIKVVGVVVNGDEAVDQAVERQPDIVLLDINMPGLACFDAAKIIAGHCPQCAIIFVSAHTHDHYIEQALKVKAAGYVTKDEPAESVIAAIRIVASGGAYFSPDVQARIIFDKKESRLVPAPRTRLSLLTPQELRVLGYIAKGMSKRTIAEKLSITTKTVETHTANLMNKLDIHDRVQLALFAIREGLAEA